MTTRIKVLSWLTDSQDRTFAPGIHTVDDATAVYLRKTFEKLVETPAKGETAEDQELTPVEHVPTPEEIPFLGGINTAKLESHPVEFPAGDDSAL